MPYTFTVSSPPIRTVKNADDSKIIELSIQGDGTLKATPVLGLVGTSPQTWDPVKYRAGLDEARADYEASPTEGDTNEVDVPGSNSLDGYFKEDEEGVLCEVKAPNALGSHFYDWNLLVGCQHAMYALGYGSAPLP